MSAATGSAQAPGPGLTLGGGNHRAVPAHARELAARLSALFERDVELVKRLNDANRRLQEAGERLWSGLAPDAFGLPYDGAAAAIASSPIAALIRDGGPDANSAMLEALQQLRWKMHRALCAYQDASEQRRQLAIEVGEYSQQLTRALRRRLERAASAAGQRARARQSASLTREPRQPPAATVPDMIEVQLTANGFQLELYVDGYEFPEFDTGRDANALACEIELDIQRRLDLHAAHNQLTLHTFELSSFVDQLRALEHAQDGRATLGDPDEESGDQFGLTIRLNGTASMLDGFLADSAATRLSFEMINIDRAFVRDALAQFAAILQAFPVRGDITDD